MFKRCFSPLTLVNQLALIVMLSTAIGVAGMAVSGWLVQGVQGSAHAINKAGSLRMQSYRLLAAVPLDAKDQKLLDEMEQTAFSPELTRAAERDGQQKQLKALQDYWHNELSPGLQHAQNAHAVAEDVTRFVAGLDRLVTSFDHTTELRIERVVLVHRVMAIFMALLLVFTIIWLRVRLLQPWKQLLSMARAVSQRDFTQRANISGRNEMAALGSALNNMSEGPVLLRTHPLMLTRKSIDTVLLSVGAEKLSQREWDWMKMLKPMDPPPAMVTTSILKRRGDTAALTLLQDTGV